MKVDLSTEMSSITINSEHIMAANPPQFAKLIGVTTSSIYRYLEGVDPSMKHIKSASSRLNIPFAEFCTLFSDWVNQEKKRRGLQKEIEIYLETLETPISA